MLKKNEEIAVTIESCTSLGSGVAHFDGMAVFAANTAPGDHVLLHIIKSKPKYAVGKVVKIIHSSKMRTQPECPVYSRCGGCAFGHIRYEDELNIKYNQVRDNLQRIGSLDIEPDEIIPSVSVSRYRNKAQYPVRADDNHNVEIGFYAPHSHRVIDCSDCLLQPEDFRSITAVIREWIRDNKISVYDEAKGKGLIRHIYLRKAVSTGEIMVCIVINGSDLPQKDELINRLNAENKNIASILLNINRKETNVVLGEECRTIYGKDFITDILCGLKFNISPLSFYQVNHDTAELLYGKAAEFAGLTGKETVIDLYCGTGTIGLTMAHKAKNIIGVEIVPQAVENAVKNAELNGISNARFLCADASQAALKLKEENIKPDVVIVDPPRKGCSEELLKTINDMAPERIVYVSCDSATLARDCKILSQFGYEVKKAVPVDMFPRAPHVETVVRLSRSDMNS